MNIKLNKLTIENFKGVKSFEVELDGENAVIKAENGIGKTTVYDAFLWLMFGKNSEGKKDFEVRPLDSHNNAIKGLVTAVEVEIDCGGIIHIFRKEHHEKVVKKQLRGHETFCTIDEVPKKVGEYADYIAELIPEDTFKLLTDLSHFSSKLHHSERRKVLLDIAGEIGTPEGFDELLAALNGREIKEYKQVLTGQKKRHEKERDEINPRIDEKQRGLDGYAFNTDTEAITGHRDKAKEEIAELDKQRQELFDNEQERQEMITVVNKLKVRRIEREAELASDTSGMKDLLDEKVKIETALAETQQFALNAVDKVTIEKAALRTDRATKDSALARLNIIREENAAVLKVPISDNCYECGQILPTDKMNENHSKLKAKLIEIEERGEAAMAENVILKQAIATREAKVNELTELAKKAEAGLQRAKANRDTRFAVIDKLIKENKTARKPVDDDVCRKLYNEIIEVNAQIGEPVSEQLQKIDNLRTQGLENIAAYDKALARADQMKRDKIRIAELEEKEKELAQKIADIEKQLADIDGYDTAVSGMIEEAVNGKFKYVEFKLFDQLLNEGLKECCEATFNGVPYSDMSTGQQIFVGIDIINVLSDHYGVSVPMFIDHSESMTLPIEAGTQTIKLFAQKETKELIVEKEGRPVKAAV